MPQIQGRPWSSDEVMEGMQACIEAQQQAVIDLLGLVRTSAEARHDYNLAKAQNLLRARADMPDLKTDALRSAWVVTQVHELELQTHIAENAIDAQRLMIRSLDSQAGLLRSMARSSRDMTDGPGWGNQQQR